MTPNVQLHHSISINENVIRIKPITLMIAV